MMNVMDILNVDGIVIRKIPETTVSHWTYREGSGLCADEELVTDDTGKTMIRRTTKNKLAGYIITFDPSQGCLVRFSKKTDGIGSTIESAYENYVSKHRVVGDKV